MVYFLHHADIQEAPEFLTDFLHHADVLEAIFFMQMEADIISAGDAREDGMQSGFYPGIEEQLRSRGPFLPETQ